MRACLHQHIIVVMIQGSEGRPSEADDIFSFQRLVSNRNRKLEISRAPTKAKSREPAYSQALNQKKTYMLWTRGKDGRKKTTKCSTGLACDRRKKQRQRKRWMDNVKEDLEEKGIQLSTAYGKTKNRDVWRNIIRASSSAG